jgi:hypothetical protein
MIERRREVARSNDPEFAERAIALIPGSAVLGIWHIKCGFGIRQEIEFGVIDALHRDDFTISGEGPRVVLPARIVPENSGLASFSVRR